MRVLVTGATGFLGGHTVDALRERGHEVRALARATSRTADLEAQGVEVARASFDDASALRAALRDVDAAVHAAGGGIAKDVAELYRSNTRSTEALLEAAPPALRRFVLVSSLAAHGPSTAGRPASGVEPDAPVSHYGKSKLAAEQAALERAAPPEVVVVRPPALYGPGEHRMVGLFRAAERGVVPIVRPHGTLSMLHGADCARAIAAAVDAPRAAGVHYLAEPRVYGRREMAEIIGRAVGRRIRVVAVPSRLLYVVGGGVELFGRVTDRPVMLTRDKAADATQPHQCCDPTAAMDVLGWGPERDFVSGAREAYRGYRRRGWL